MIKNPRRIRVLSILGGVIAGCGLLIFLAVQSNPTLLKLSIPDVDTLLREYREARTDVDNERLWEQIRGLGYGGSRRLREIAIDRSRNVEDQRLAIALLKADPSASFDMLALLDDPDSGIKFAARESVRYCIAAGHYPRDPKSDTEAQLLQKWYREHSQEGYAAIKFGDRGSDAGGSTGLSAEKIFSKWSENGNLLTTSPYFSDLRAMGRPATLAILSLARSDLSAQKRRMAFVALGMLGDTSAVIPLQEMQNRPLDPQDRNAIELGLKMLNRR